jgi:TolA-binding protein
MRQSKAASSLDDRNTAMASETKTDTEKALGDIKKEVIEARNLVIKTDSLLKSFHVELKAVAKQQEDFARKQWVSSAVAYALFAVLSVGAAVLLTSARGHNAAADRERLEKRVAELTTQLEQQNAEASAVAESRQGAAHVYKMMTTLSGDERLKGIDELVKLDTSRLSPLERSALTDRATLLRKEVGDVAYERGKAAFRRNDMATTAEELSRFMAMNPAPGDAQDAAFYLGVAYNQLRKHEPAVTMLTRFLDGDKKTKNRDYAMVLLAHSLEQTGQLDKAAEVAREGLNSYPNSEFAPQLRKRLSVVKALQGGSGEAPAQPAAPVTATPAAP